MKRLIDLRRYRPHTLQLSLPAGQTLALAAVLLVVSVVVIEVVLRIPAVQSRLPAPSVRSQYLDFEVKLQRLREMERVDCVFLGSSIVNRGLSPADFEQGYQTATGQPITCFNLGIGGAGENTGVLLAHYVMKVYHPSLLVFGVSPRLRSGGGKGPLAELPWIKYQQGVFSLHGWLAEHSALYGYGRSLAEALTGMPNSRRRMFFDRMILANGFYMDNAVIEFPITPGERERIERSNYTVDDVWLGRLDEMMAFHQPPQTQVVIVEMPVHPVALDGYEDMLRDYAESISVITARAEAKGVPFFATSRLDLVSGDENWIDFNHLNATGAAIFSRWLGEQVGEAVRQGALSIPASED